MFYKVEAISHNFIRNLNFSYGKFIFKSESNTLRKLRVVFVMDEVVRILPTNAPFLFIHLLPTIYTVKN
jgi:hypothetical protein